METNRSLLNAPRIVFGVLTVLCMVLIFCFSMENSDESSATSGSVTDKVIDAVYDDYDEMSESEQESIKDKVERVIRKCAHFSVFTMLGFFASMTAGRRKLFGRGTAFTLLFCVLYACSDEIHQLFVPGRAGMIMDVIIDTGGALTGILISFLVMLITAKLTNNKLRT